MIEPKQRKSTRQNGDSESLYRHGLKNVVLEILRGLCVCSVSTTKNCFVMLSRLKIHIILFLDRLRRVA